MKTLKVMSTIGLVLAGISWLCMSAFDNIVDYESGIGWGMIAMLYLIALSIVCLVQTKKNK